MAARVGGKASVSRTRGKVFGETRRKRGESGVGGALKRGDHRGHSLARHRLLGRIRLGPDRHTAIDIVEFDLEADARGGAWTGDLIEMDKTAAQQKIAAGFASLQLHAAEAPGLAEGLDDQIFEDFSGRFHPTMGLVHVDLVVFGEVDELILAVDMRRDDMAHKERDGKRIGRGLIVRAWRQIDGVIAEGTGRAAGSESDGTQQEQTAGSGLLPWNQKAGRRLAWEGEVHGLGSLGAEERRGDVG